MESKEKVFIEHIKNHLKDRGALIVTFSGDLYCEWCKKSMNIIYQDYKNEFSKVLMETIREGWCRI